jgi:hypothetical protein
MDRSDLPPTANTCNIRPVPHSKLLIEILHSAKQAKTKGDALDVVFDLDSTIFCVSHRTQAILRELAEDLDLQARFPEATRQLARLEATARDWGIRTVLERAKIAATVDFFESLRQKWADRFFSSTHLHIDEPYPGAIEFLHTLDNAGARIHYLTGRDAPRMGKGTLESFKKWAIPLKSPNFLHMKPDSHRHDAEFKRDTLSQILGPTRAGWFFENEPVIINLVRKHFPLLKIVFVDSVHSGREAPPTDLPVLHMSYEIKPSN